MPDKNFQDAGRMMKMAACEPMMEEEKYFQTLLFTEDMLPEIGTWEPGEKYRVELIVRQQDLMAPEGEDKPREALFKVLAVRATANSLTADQQKMVEQMA